jgi:hypothetical protein
LECDTPQSLLSNANSQFSLLVEQTGSHEADHLRILANVPKSNAEQNREIVICNENSLADDIETNPLLMSVKL